MLPRFDYGDAVRVTRNVRNDGTYPGLDTGELLIRRGAIGYVRDVGTYLQDQLIYRVVFMDPGVPGVTDSRMVGCRDEELIGADDPWVPSRFESREKVRAALSLSVEGEVRVHKDAVGEVMKVLRDLPGGAHYQVYFSGCGVLQVPERVLSPLEEGEAALATEGGAEHERHD
ncbi:MAG: nitrogen fixation protein NifZ [Rhodocyclaceae bacterium]|jgi:nitrogen fixation protein NifZ|nr:nitrogen fixation protein NifZ [Rhodocyclaceae bacterium]